MIKKVYYCNVERLGTGTTPNEDVDYSLVVVPKNKGIYVSTFDVGSITTLAPCVTKKVDLLFYSRVNTLGKVLSTIVYTGEVRDVGDTSDIPYFPELLFQNSSVELQWENLDCETDFTYVNYERCPPEPESYWIKQDEAPLPIDGMPANIIPGNTPVLDGWYTLVSAGVCVDPDFSYAGDTWGGYHIGSFAQNSTDGKVYFSLIQNPTADYDNTTQWHDYTVWDKTINLLGHFVDCELYPPEGCGGATGDIPCNIDPPFIRQDFFVMLNYDREYSRYLPGFSREIRNLNDSFPALKCKHRVIDRTAEDPNYKESQLYLQSTDYIRIKGNLI